jgi:hypothetical protein
VPRISVDYKNRKWLDMQETHASCSTKIFLFFNEQSAFFLSNLIRVGEKSIEHTNWAQSEEKIGRYADNDDPSAAEGINGLRTKDMIPTQNTDTHQNQPANILP